MDASRRKSSAVSDHPAAPARHARHAGQPSAASPPAILSSAHKRSLVNPAFGPLDPLVVDPEHVMETLPVRLVGQYLQLVQQEQYATLEGVRALVARHYPDMLRTAHDIGSMHRAAQVLARDVHTLTRAFARPFVQPLGGNALLGEWPENVPQSTGDSASLSDSKKKSKSKSKSKSEGEREREGEGEDEGEGESEGESERKKSERESKGESLEVPTRQKGPIQMEPLQEVYAVAGCAALLRVLPRVGEILLSAPPRPQTLHLAWCHVLSRACWRYIGQQELRQAGPASALASTSDPCQVAHERWPVLKAALDHIDQVAQRSIQRILRTWRKPKVFWRSLVSDMVAYAILVHPPLSDILHLFLEQRTLALARVASLPGLMTQTQEEKQQEIDPEQAVCALWERWSTLWADTLVFASWAFLSLPPPPPPSPSPSPAALGSNSGQESTDQGAVRNTLDALLCGTSTPSPADGQGQGQDFMASTPTSLWAQVNARTMIQAIQAVPDSEFTEEWGAHLPDSIWEARPDLDPGPVDEQRFAQQLAQWSSAAAQSLWTGEAVGLLDRLSSVASIGHVGMHTTQVAQAALQSIESRIDTPPRAAAAAAAATAPASVTPIHVLIQAARDSLSAIRTTLQHRLDSVLVGLYTAQLVEMGDGFVHRLAVLAVQPDQDAKKALLAPTSDPKDAEDLGHHDPGGKAVLLARLQGLTLGVDTVLAPLNASASKVAQEMDSFFHPVSPSSGASSHFSQPTHSSIATTPTPTPTPTTIDPLTTAKTDSEATTKPDHDIPQGQVGSQELRAQFARAVQALLDRICHALSALGPNDGAEPRMPSLPPRAAAIVASACAQNPALARLASAAGLDPEEAVHRRLEQLARSGRATWLGARASAIAQTYARSLSSGVSVSCPSNVGYDVSRVRGPHPMQEQDGKEDTSTASPAGLAITTANSSSGLQGGEETNRVPLPSLALLIALLDLSSAVRQVAPVAAQDRAYWKEETLAAFLRTCRPASEAAVSQSTRSCIDRDLLFLQACFPPFSGRPGAGDGNGLGDGDDQAAAAAARQVEALEHVSRYRLLLAPLLCLAQPEPTVLPTSLGDRASFAPAPTEAFEQLAAPRARFRRIPPVAV